MYRRRRLGKAGGFTGQKQCCEINLGPRIARSSSASKPGSRLVRITHSTRTGQRELPARAPPRHSQLQPPYGAAAPPRHNSAANRQNSHKSRQAAPPHRHHPQVLHSAARSPHSAHQPARHSSSSSTQALPAPLCSRLAPPAGNDTAPSPHPARCRSRGPHSSPAHNAQSATRPPPHAAILPVPRRIFLPISPQHQRHAIAEPPLRTILRGGLAEPRSAASESRKAPGRW